MDPIFRFPNSPAPHFQPAATPLYPISASEANRRNHDANTPDISAEIAAFLKSFPEAREKSPAPPGNPPAEEYPHNPVDVAAFVNQQFPENRPAPKQPQLPAGLTALRKVTYQHSRAASDVQGRVAQFNTMSKEAAQRRKDHEASLQRAVLGREQAESESRRLREENRILRMQVEEGKARERRVGERVEGVMEELQRVNETHAHAQNLYEAEVRRARKEAFKASSTLVKLQEELKSARNDYTKMKEEMQTQKQLVEEQEQTVAYVQYKAAGLEEDVENLREQMRLSDNVREAYKACLKEEEAIRAEHHEKMDTLRSIEEERDSLKCRMEVVDENREALETSLEAEKAARNSAEKTIDFMQMECQFHCCSCRIAEKHGHQFIHDDGPAAKLTNTSEQKKPIIDLSRSNKYQPPTCSSPILEHDNDMAEQLLELSPKTGPSFPILEPVTSPEVMSPIRLPRIPTH